MTVKWLHDQSWQDVEDYLKKDKRIILPAGSIEQHGRFAPLGTDTMAAVAVSGDASHQTGVLVAPPLWFGWSPHHLVKPGTMSIRAEVLIEILCDMIGSLAEHGFHFFVVVNGHRIVNLPWMQIAAQRVQEDFGIKVALFDLAHMSKEIAAHLNFGPIGHAEEIEISHMLHCHPELVKIKDARDNLKEDERLYHIDPRDGRDTLVYVPATIDEMEALYEKTGDCIKGTPSAATAGKGKVYHEHLVKRLVDVLGNIR